ncbi:MAG: RNA polymerase sigma factor [Prolixibacteraceae bacterium]|nr:RNA polymerase sigma factor [Prolixibacteraceae bacterium]
MGVGTVETRKDEELVSLVLQGQSKYFDVLYKRYYNKVFDKCTNLLKNRELAEEFTKDVFSKVFEKLTSFKNKSSFSTWLYSITYNYCIDYLRNKKKLHYPDWNRNNEMPEIIDESDEDTASIEYDNFLKVLEMVHPEEKALLIMKYQDNISLREISCSLRISEDAAKMRLKRARTRVFYLYKKEFGESN